MDVSSAVKALRQAAGLSREQLAEAAGISSEFLAKVEQGRRRPSPGTLTSIAGALRISREELLVRGALLEAGNSPTDEEMYRHLLRGAAVGGAAASLAAPFIGALVAPAAIGVAVGRIRAHRKGGGIQEPVDGLDLSEIRRLLIAQIEAMPDEQLTAFLGVALPPEPSRDTTDPSAETR